MKSTPRLVILAILVLLSLGTNAQWLKMIESSDNLYKDAKREIDLKHYQKAINLCNKAKDISPHNLDIHLLLGRAFSLAGKIDSARYELNFVIEKNPKYRDAYIYLINLEAIACNYLQALEYADQGLKYFPNDRDILLKKLDIYRKEGDWMEANKMADYLYEHFSTDAYIRSVFLDFKLDLARQYSHRGYIEIAKRAYESVLEQDPMNKEALQAIYALDVRSGNYESSLEYVNRALTATPNSYEFLMKKVAILDAMSRYLEAIEVVEKLSKLYKGNPEVHKLNIYIRMEAGRFFLNSDPYTQFQAVLEKDPGNTEALNYCINIAFSRGLLSVALRWVNYGLKNSPNDRELLKKKLGILEQEKNYGQAAIIAERLYKENRSQLVKDEFIELKLQSAKQFMNDQAYDSAAKALKVVLYYDHNNVTALNYLINSYLAEKRYDDALQVIDQALEHNPDDEQMLFKKAGILETSQRYEDAAAISGRLLQKHHDNRQYLVSLVEQSLAAGRQSMQYDDYYNTLKILKEVLDAQPDNVDALNYMINIQMALKQYPAALQFVDQALRYYPESTDFLFKKSVVNAEAKNYQAAYAISGQLYANFPYNVRFKTAYVDQLIGSGKQYMENSNTDSALIEFRKALAEAPSDTIPLYYTINLLNQMGQYDSALTLIDHGRFFYPSNPYFLTKRALILESQKKWYDAWLSEDTLLKMNPFDLKVSDYDQYLYSHTLRNEIGLFYLHSLLTDSLGKRNLTSIATAQYTRRWDGGSLTGRINYAGRFNGTGYEFEAEANINHKKNWYSWAMAGYSPDPTEFPDLRLGYSLFHSFHHGYTGELGLRYMYISLFNNATYLSPVIGISKELSDFYLSLRGSPIFVNYTGIANKNYFAVSFSSKYYLRENHTEFFSFIAGYGNAPDDIIHDFSAFSLNAYNTVTVGAGYQRQIFYRTTIMVNVAWSNLQSYTNYFLNQYDVNIGLLRRF